MEVVTNLANTEKLRPRLIGAFFIIATISSILGLKMYDPLLSDADFLNEGAEHYNQIITGALFELILACTAVGTGIMLFPYLKGYNETWGLAYFCFRLLEVVFILIGIISVLGMLSLSQDFSNSSSPDKDHFELVGQLLKSIHDWSFMLGPNFMLGINTFIYSYVFFRTGLIPKNLSLLGIMAATLIFIAALLEMFGVIEQLSISGVLLAFPVFLFEMIFALRLIVRGIHIP